jgi:hypothetical protein
MDMDMDIRMDLLKLGDGLEWGKWRTSIPCFNFPADWYVRIIPPFANGIIRFLVDDNQKMNDPISIYLDCYDFLGCENSPYWEAYPIEGNTYRCLMENAEELIQVIDKELKRRSR